MVTPNFFMATIDIKDAYFSVPIAPEHRKYFRFEWKGKLLQCAPFPNGLASCPCLFTKMLRPVYAGLRKIGDEIVPYIELPTPSISTKKVLAFLGFVLNSIDMTAKLTPDEANHLREACKKTFKYPTPRDVAQVISLMVSSAPAVELCRFFLPNTGE